MNLIYADIMKVDSEGRLILSCRGTHDDLERRGTSLRDGLSLVFYNDDEDEHGNRDDLVVKGIVEYDNESERWVARIDWDAIKNTSSLSAEEKLYLEIPAR